MNPMHKPNPALRLVKEVKEFHVKTLADMKPAVELLSTGEWIVISAAGSEEHYLFSLGRVC